MSHVEDEDVDDFLYGDSSNKKAGTIEQKQESGKLLPELRKIRRDPYYQ